MDYWVLSCSCLVLYLLFMFISNILLYIKNLRINTILNLKIIDNIQPVNLNRIRKNNNNHKDLWN